MSELILLYTLLASAGVFFFSKKYSFFYTLFVLTLFIGITSFYAISVFSLGKPLTIQFPELLFNLKIKIEVLSAFFILVVNFAVLTGLIYSYSYLKPYQNTKQKMHFSLHYFAFMWLAFSMFLVTTVQETYSFLIVWELMTLASFLIVIFDSENQEVLQSGINYLIQMHIGFALLVVAFFYAGITSKDFTWQGLDAYFSSESNIPIFILFFIGFGLKAGFIPLHTWLPKAHPAAPSHVSGIMSGVMVKMGIFGIFKVITYLHSNFLIIGEIVLALSLLTGLFGIINAAVHRDFKKMLAYCTIENIGIIGIGLGLGLIGMAKDELILVVLGFSGALIHVLNHSLFKTLLFYTAGAVYQQTHTRNMEHLGGLIKKMPQTALLFLIGAISIAGIPPFNGFISEFIIYSGLIAGFDSSGTIQILVLLFTIIGMSVIGGISILTFTKTFGAVFLGSPRTELKHKPREVSFFMLLPQYATILVMLAVAFFPAFFMNKAALIISQSFNISLENLNLNFYTNTLSEISLYSLFFIALVALIFTTRYFLTRNNSVTYSQTWGCGYVAPNSRMQYTGKSFSKTIGKLLNFIVIEKKSYPELTTKEIFPKTRSYSSYYHDIFEVKLIDPLMQVIKKSINLFQFVQNGRIQTYVLYGIIFMLLVFIGTILNIL